MKLLLAPSKLTKSTIVALLSLVSTFPCPALAETRYVKPPLDVAVRQDQNTTSKTVANVPLGTAVEVVRGTKDWSLVRLPNNTEGWIKTRMLSTSPILPTTSAKGGSEAVTPDIPARFRELTEEISRLRKELAACTTDRSTLADKYQTLAGDPNSMLFAKTSLGEAQRQIEELQAKLAAAQIENTVLHKNESIKWFLVGSVVLFAGWFIGRISATNRKKKSSLL